ncbi:helix-turn-helix transcriptional regulator [Flavobacterium sp.]|uniref:helix-turn-helix transcriptional regulator n=1 Tax=Flavobacterium sp. TaxID=239 RepID=UPI0025D609E2|nr:helix-turn-helix transcriptional regulator [Flavobacterium sp.]
MKKTTITITSLLGLTHKQMALLLQVSRSQWSMYESGKRHLPLKARQLLAEMIGFLKFEDKGAKVRQLVMEQEEAEKKDLEKQLRANDDQLYLIGKAITQIEVKYNGNLAAIGFVDYIATLPHTRQKLDGELLEIIASAAERAIRKSGMANLKALRRKQELLELEKLIIGSALNKVTKNLHEIRA